MLLFGSYCFHKCHNAACFPLRSSVVKIFKSNVSTIIIACLKWDIPEQSSPWECSWLLLAIQGYQCCGRHHELSPNDRSVELRGCLVVLMVVSMIKEIERVTHILMSTQITLIPHMYLPQGISLCIIGGAPVGENYSNQVYQCIRSSYYGPLLDHL